MLTTKQFKENLLVIKNRSGLTAYQIAHNANMRENTVYCAFNPQIKRSLRLDTYMKICDGMGVGYDEAFMVHLTKDQMKKVDEGISYFSSIKTPEYRNLAVAELKHIYEQDLKKSREQETKGKKRKS